MASTDRYEIVKMNRGCPKENGWWSGRVRLLEDGGKTFSVVSVGVGGNAPLGLAEGCEVELDLAGVRHGAYGEQREVVRVRVLKASDASREAIVRQLSGSEYPGIGPVIAGRIVDAFGPDLSSALAMDDDELAARCKMSAKQAVSLKWGLSQAYAKAALAAEMPSLSARDVGCVSDGLAKRGEFSSELAGMLGMDVKQFLESCPVGDAIPKLTAHPFTMCMAGVSFEHADMVWRVDRKRPSEHPERVRCGVYWALRKTLEGDMWEAGEGFARDVDRVSAMSGSTRLELTDSDWALALQERASTMLGGFVSADVLWEVLSDLERRGDVTLAKTGGRVHVSCAKVHEQEESIAGSLSELAAKRPAGAKRAKVLARGFPALNPSQRKAFVGALSHGVSIVTGGPGRGKTFVAGAIAKAWRAEHAGAAVIGLAPTGKAAGRLRESLSGAVDPSDVATCALFNVLGGGIGFGIDLLAIVDETSMLDVNTTAQMLRHLARRDATVVFLGDEDQLPSVGAGDVFCDMLTSETIPVYALEENMRAKAGSAVARHADDMVSEYAGAVTRCLTAEPDFDVFMSDSAENTAQWALMRYLELWGNGVPASDIALLCAKSGWGKANPTDPTCAMLLAKRVRDSVNPDVGSPSGGLGFDVAIHERYLDERGCPVHGTWHDPVRIGDRVLCAKNNSDIVKLFLEDGEYGGEKLGTSGPLVNGDIGEVVRYYPYSEFVVVRFDDGSWADIPTRVFGEDFLLGWAMTVHKSQGSEYPHVIAVMPQSGRRSFLNRNLLYTAVTRASEDVALAGGTMALLSMTSQPRMRRCTWLGDMLSS